MMQPSNYPAGFRATTWCRALLAVCLLGIPWAGVAADATNASSAEAYDYASPALVTGTIYASGSDRKQILFTFRRTATRDGDTVHAVRQFLATNGAVAAQEDVTYNAGRLVNFQMREFQANQAGAIRVEPDPKHPDRQRLFISFGRGLTPPAKGDTESLAPDTVIADTLFPFMLEHWDDLMRGDAVKFHFVSLEKERTYVFRFVRAGEAVQDGRAIERIKMEPVSKLVAAFVDPIWFTVEKDSPHHILTYNGRTTPRIQKGKAWKYLDAETVFDWPARPPAAD